MITIENLSEYANRKNLEFISSTQICHDESLYSSKDKPVYKMRDGSHKRRAVSYFGVEVSTGVWYWETDRDWETLNFFFLRTLINFQL